MQDQFQRKIEYLRISVTDCCNLRYRYCMPAHGVKKLRHADVLTYEEILRDVRALAALGVRKVRLTGGEPLVRRDITRLVRGLKEIPGIETVALTTNGVLLGTMMDELLDAGLDAVNLSLDTLDGGTFFSITRRPMFGAVMEAITRLAEEERLTVKVNCVPIMGVNDEELAALAALARAHPIDVRFIELMPIGCARTESFLKLCLYSNAGLDTRALLRGGMSDAQLADAIAHAVWKKPEEHHFEIDQETRDHRAMYQVGG